MNKIKTHLRYHFVYYIFIPVIISLIWLTQYNKLTEVKEYEELDVTIIGSGIDHITLKENIENYIYTVNDEIKEVNVESMGNLKEYEFNTLIRSRMQGRTDIILISKSLSSELKIDFGSYFKNIESNKFDEYFNGANKIIKDELIYGIEIEIKGESWYLFMNNSSINLGDLYINNNNHRCAIDIINYLLEEDIYA